jgi:hypothetical protein
MRLYSTTLRGTPAPASTGTGAASGVPGFVLAEHLHIFTIESLLVRIFPAIPIAIRAEQTPPESCPYVP